MVEVHRRIFQASLRASLLVSVAHSCQRSHVVSALGYSALVKAEVQERMLATQTLFMKGFEFSKRFGSKVQIDNVGDVLAVVARAISETLLLDNSVNRNQPL